MQHFAYIAKKDKTDQDKGKNKLFTMLVYGGSTKSVLLPPPGTVPGVLLPPRNGSGPSFSPFFLYF